MPDYGFFLLCVCEKCEDPQIKNKQEISFPKSKRKW